jgi:hypothetical protein
VCDRLGKPVATPGSYRAGIVESENYKVWTEIEGCDIDVAPVYTMMSERYGVDESELHRVDRLIRAIPSVPWYLSDPVFDRLLQVDYL